MPKPLIKREIAPPEDDDDEADPRSCTDPICCGLWLVFYAVVWYVVFFCAKSGDVSKLTHGADWEGHICGYSKNASLGYDVSNKPYLFWCDAGQGEQLSDGICVTECPKDSSKTHLCPGVPATRRIENKAENTVEFRVTRTLKEKSDYPTSALLYFCLPSGSSESALRMVEMIAGSSQLGGSFKKVMFSIQAAFDDKYLVMGLGITAIVIGYVYMFLLRTFIMPLVYTLAALVGVGLVGLTYWLYTLSAATPWCFWAAVASCVLLVVYLIVLCFARSAIQITITSVQKSCEIMVAMPTLLLQPLMQSTIQLLVFIFGVIGLVVVLSVGEVDAGNAAFTPAMMGVSGISRDVTYDNSEYAMIAIYIFGFVWFFNLVDALGNYTISHAVVCRELLGESFAFPLARGYWNGIRYHLGTLAFGSFIIGFLQILATLCTFILKQTKDQEGKQAMAAKVACGCCACCLKCLEKVMQWVNVLVYTDCAIEGTDYPQAAKNVIKMAIDNPITYSIVKGSTSVVRFLGLAFITGGGAGLAYLIKDNSATLNAAIQSAAAKMGKTGVEAASRFASADVLTSTGTVGVTVATGVLCLFIAMAFMSVFSVSADSQMYCLLWKISNGEAGEDDIPEGWKAEAGGAAARELVLKIDKAQRLLAGAEEYCPPEVWLA
jgi:hypothetical protein